MVRPVQNPGLYFSNQDSSRCYRESSSIRSNFQSSMPVQSIQNTEIPFPAYTNSKSNNCALLDLDSNRFKDEHEIVIEIFRHHPFRIKVGWKSNIIFPWREILGFDEMVKRCLCMRRRVCEPRQPVGDLSVFQNFVNSEIKINEVYLHNLEDIELRLFGDLPWFTRVDGDPTIASEYRDPIMIPKINLPMLSVPIVDRIFMQERMFEEPDYIMDHLMFPKENCGKMYLRCSINSEYYYDEGDEDEEESLLRVSLMVHL
ncbi:hypothetical protein L6452_05570 [Arctium lappa]|uniref:Uncharacterized protein n=1 Tax=Arctium lappa TaxID=4217 RepID=A0ACB9EHG9_ARCLA|nr:hypothetical protein L6452_05570 [Arctium lappa]